MVRVWAADFGTASTVLYCTAATGEVVFVVNGINVQHFIEQSRAHVRDTSTESLMRFRKSSVHRRGVWDTFLLDFCSNPRWVLSTVVSPE